MMAFLARAACIFASVAWAAGSTAMRDRMDTNEMMETLQGLQDLATVTFYAPNGTRDRSSPAHNGTIDFLIAKIKNMDNSLNPVKQTYPEKVWRPLGKSELLLTVPSNIAFAEDTDFVLWWWSPFLDLTALVAEPTGAIIGCSADDWVNFPAGKIALVERGECGFSVKIGHANDAGASAILISWQEAEKDSDLFSSKAEGTNIPVLVMSYASGQQFRPVGDTTKARIFSNSEAIETGVSNIILDLPGGDPTSVVVVGAHLDSVLLGPGINDDGSGTAVVMEMLRAFGQVYGFEGNSNMQKNAVRFCWWTSEEWGLKGSRHYVDELTLEENHSIAGYLNFDMMGSPNGFNSIINGSSDPRTPDASEYIQHKIEGAFESLGEPWALWPITSSDFVPFFEGGIPAGAIRSGAGQIKTPEEAVIFGGKGNEPFDACYHKQCDTIDNIDPVRMLTFSKVGATVLEDFLLDADLREHLHRPLAPLPPATTDAPTEAPTPTPAPTPPTPPTPPEAPVEENQWFWIISGVVAVVLCIGGLFFFPLSSSEVEPETLARRSMMSGEVEIAVP